jgi:hypothetical protein
MIAGKPLDKLLVEKLMGWTRLNGQFDVLNNKIGITKNQLLEVHLVPQFIYDTYHKAFGSEVDKPEIPNYSTNTLDALKIVDEILIRFNLSFHSKQMFIAQTSSTVYTVSFVDYSNNNKCYTVYAKDSFPEAICLAALDVLKGKKCV